MKICEKEKKERELERFKKSRIFEIHFCLSEILLFYSYNNFIKYFPKTDIRM